LNLDVSSQSVQNVNLVKLIEIGNADLRSCLRDAYCGDAADFASIAAESSYLILRCTSSGNCPGKTKKKVLKNIARSFYRQFFVNIVFLRKKVGS
jgi:hypothetical protein